MSELSPHLKSEVAIKWPEDPKKYPYVREKFDVFSFRSRFPLSQYQQTGQFKLLGYSEISLTANTIGDGFYRRLFYLMLPNDPYSKGIPQQAVIPSTIKPGVTSESGRADK
jgi:hypothetical protein